MPYFSYHKTAKKLIREGKLIKYRILPEYNHISPALVLYFDSEKHPVIPIREHRWEEYLPLLEKYRNISPKEDK
jgi:hypothetical protein